MASGGHSKRRDLDDSTTEPHRREDVRAHGALLGGPGFLPFLLYLLCYDQTFPPGCLPVRAEPY